MSLSINVQLELIVSQMSVQETVELIGVCLQHLKNQLSVTVTSPVLPGGPSGAPMKATLQTLTPPGFPHYEFTASVYAMLGDGNHVGAIKKIREQTNLGLKDAKDIADFYRAKMIEGYTYE